MHFYLSCMNLYLNHWNSWQTLVSMCIVTKVLMCYPTSAGVLFLRTTFSRTQRRMLSLLSSLSYLLPFLFVYFLIISLSIDVKRNSLRGWRFTKRVSIGQRDSQKQGMMNRLSYCLAILATEFQWGLLTSCCLK